MCGGDWACESSLIVCSVCGHVKWAQRLRRPDIDMRQYNRPDRSHARLPDDQPRKPNGAHFGGKYR
jgi:hypothetical protein